MSKNPNSPARPVLFYCAIALLLTAPPAGTAALASSDQIVPASAGDAWSGCFASCSWPCYSARYSDELEVSEETEAACRQQSNGDTEAFETCVADAYVDACVDDCSASCRHLLEGDSGFKY